MYPGISADSAHVVVQLVAYFITAVVALLSWLTMMRG
jgi:hypothetical protein